MVYRKKTYKKKIYRKRPYKKVNTFKRDFRLGQTHQWNQSDASGVLTPLGTPLISVHISNVSAGDLLNNRQANLVYFRNSTIRMSFRNTAVQSRSFRMAAVTLVNTTVAADTVNWTDLLIDATYNNVPAKSGLDQSMIFRINKAIYKPLWQRRFTVSGTSDGQINSKIVNYNIPIKTYTSYNYNSALPRKNPVWFVMWCAEEPGVTAANTDVDYSLTMNNYYSDVIKNQRIP